MLTVKSVDKGSIAEEIGLRAGDVIVAFDGKEALDILDYSYYDNADRFVMTVKRGETVEDYEIEKDEWEELGVDFTDNCYLTPKACLNKCVFCFVDQLPKGLRRTLYVKDDDYRLSFATGNYVTLTNIGEKEISRITDRKFSPLYISVHATDEAVRKYLLGRPQAPDLMPVLKRFAAAGIVMHTQVVMCPGINDGEVLMKTVRELADLYPQVKSLAVVPVGLTGHRNGLAEVKPVDEETARRTIESCDAFNKTFREKRGENFVFCSDEMYVKADIEVPDEEYYGDFEQIENGVGLLTELKRDCGEALEGSSRARKGTFAILTGVSAFDYISREVGKIKSLYPDLDATVIAVKNEFFGESVTVTGLLTGGDLLKTIKKLPRNATVLLPRVMLREFENVFLDGMTVDELRKAGKRNIEIVETGGIPLVEALTR